MPMPARAPSGGARARARAVAGEISRDCLGARLRLLTRFVTAVFDASLRPLGVKPSQLNVLVLVALLEPVRHETVCRLLHLEKSTLSRNVERMEARGWLAGAPGSDARARELSLTAAGAHLVERCLPAWRRAQERAEAELGPAFASAIRASTARLVDPQVPAGAATAPAPIEES